MPGLPIGVLLSLLALAMLPAAAGAAPSCGEPPEIQGNTIIGTPCADFIPPPPRAVTRVFGEGGDDVIFGGRGNDRLNGGEGNDHLYGGIGDDQLRGNNGNDWLSGGFGADSALDGEAGNDFVRGDATIDHIQNSGGGIDTLSYASGVTPGFSDRQGHPHFYPDFSAYDDFPPTVAGRGAYINLRTGKGDNGIAAEGGGVDEEVEAADFDVVIGTAFADFIVGTEGDQVFYGGGGADVILGEGGDDTAYGGAEGDSCDATTTVECEFDEEKVEPRNPSTVSAGEMAPGADAPPALYLTGRNVGDSLVASYSVISLQPPRFEVSLTANGSPAGTFVFSERPDSIVLAGLAGNDTLTATGFPAATSVVLLGGDGEDSLVGGETEDALVDGPGHDAADARGGDDAVTNNAGDDNLHAGPGEDLFVSNAVCDGSVLDGGPDRDNANWAQLKDVGVTIDMTAKAVGLVGPQGQAQCPDVDLLTDLMALEDIEGTSNADVLVGDTANNQLLGRPGADSYFAAAGDDNILANSGELFDDPDPTIDCGEGSDLAQIDRPENGPDAAPTNCEEVEERAPNSFRPPNTPVDPNPEPPAPVIDPVLSSPPPLPRPPRPPRPDVKPPSTRLLHRPAQQLFASQLRRRVAFAFTAGEPGTRFRCKLDRKRFRPCRSPRAYFVKPGRHAFRVFAIDAAGNRDRTPALARFRVRRR